MGFQAFVACITGSPGSFWWHVLFHSDPYFQPRVLYEMGFQVFVIFVACITDSPGPFWWYVLFHSDPEIPPRNISKHPETS